MSLLLDSVLEAARPHVAGRVARVLGLNLEVVGLQLPIGSAVSVETDLGPVIAEVVAIRDDELVCMPLGDLRDKQELRLRRELFDSALDQAQGDF